MGEPEDDIARAIRESEESDERERHQEGLIAAAVAAERERCAKIAESIEDTIERDHPDDLGHQQGWNRAAEEIAARIRKGDA